MKKWNFGFLISFIVLILTACPDSGGTSPIKGDFSLVGNPVTIIIGQSGTTNIVITRTGNFADLVNLSLIGQPVGVTPSFNPSSANTASTVMLAVDNTVAAGIYNLTVVGTAAGKTHNSPAFTLTVKPKQDNGSFSLNASNVNVTKDSVVINNIVTLANGNSSISIDRKNGFSGAIKLTTKNLPTDVTPTFTPNNTTGDSSTLKLELGANAPIGTHIVKVIGTSGTKSAEATFTLTINPKADNSSFSLLANSVIITKNQSTNSPQELATVSSTIKITRNNFDGPIHLETEDLPVGINPMFSPNDTTGNGSTLRLEIAADANVAANDYTVTIKASSGEKTAETSFVLTIKDFVDTKKPQIINTVPSDGAKAVKDNTIIVVVFSEEMDKQSTEAAFSSPDLGELRFTWINANKTMIVRPKLKLAYSPNMAYKYYNYIISTNAKDLAGNHLENSYSAKFATYRTSFRRIIAEPLLDGYITRYLLSFPLSSSFNLNDGFLIVGDDSNIKYHRAFISFDISYLPAKTLKIKQATVAAYQYYISGDPYSLLDGIDDSNLQIEHVYYGTSLTSGNLDNKVLSDSSIEFSEDSSFERKKKIVSSWVNDDLENRGDRENRSQFRLLFLTKATSSSIIDQPDQVRFYSANSSIKAYRPYLEIYAYVP